MATSPASTVAPTRAPLTDTELLCAGAEISFDAEIVETQIAVVEDKLHSLRQMMRDQRYAGVNWAEVGEWHAIDTLLMASRRLATNMRLFSDRLDATGMAKVAA